MTLTEWTNGRGMRMALGAFVLGLAACAWTYHVATTRLVLPAAVPSSGIVAGALETPGKAPEVNVGSAVALDLFADDRKAPPKRYRLPGEAEPAAPVIPPTPVLIGTGFSNAGKWFAVLTLDRSSPQYVYVGDPVMSNNTAYYTVKSIERGKVTFVSTTTGKQLDVLVPNTGR